MKKWMRVGKDNEIWEYEGEETWPVAQVLEINTAKELEDNSNLIAAAPELLHTAKAVEAMLTDWVRRDTSCEFLLSLLRPAIAKAEGTFLKNTKEGK